MTYQNLITSKYYYSIGEILGHDINYGIGGDTSSDTNFHLSIGQSISTEAIQKIESLTGSKVSYISPYERYSGQSWICIVFEQVTPKSEYVIWGRRPGDNEERLLLTEFKGQRITSHRSARSLAKILQVTHSCTHIRIQTIDFTEPVDFSKTLNL